MAKILLVLTGHHWLGGTDKPTGFHVGEAAYPYKAFTAAGHTVDLVTPGSGTPQPDSLDDHDPVQREFMTLEKVRSHLAQPTRPSDVNAADYDAIFYAGGHGAMWDFPDDAPLADLARDIYEAGGVVSAVCHGPAGLVNVTLSTGKNIVDGKQVAAFTNAEEAAVKADGIVPFALETALVDKGAKHTGADNFASHVVTDGRLVTGQNPASADGVAHAVLGVLAQR
ncbi:MAG TPA: type 1 glutamine amidotransferase domain-containing protein [Stackebrandtia sp.]|uniref:type 1 glutamine amidotransferase domain-containing protein n=1 Tax=Stackebrandtia sp. TaxID=2023065 RepID=UPI002D61D9AE|nr:type 1 glutamine amidotransferase domain-containing protein [Stackebrandtia sp.]HZE41806.1 type 1 glutamine amidotransferase domain-containing protein [Stackebrandtia sp.]